MATPLFFKRPLGLTVGEIAVLTGAEPSAEHALIISLPVLRHSIEQVRPTSHFLTRPNTPTL